MVKTPLQRLNENAEYAIFPLMQYMIEFFYFLIQSGNDYGDEFDDLRYVMPQVMIIKLRVEEPKIVFDPPFREIRDIILRCFSEIIASGEGLMRVIYFYLITVEY